MRWVINGRSITNHVKKIYKRKIQNNFLKKIDLLEYKVGWIGA